MKSDFLKNLKSGDTIGVYSGYTWIIGIVKKITPTGRIVVKYGNGETTFNKYGQQIGGDSLRWNRVRLIEITEEMKIERKMNNLLYNLKEKYDFKKMNLKQLEEVINLLNSYNIEKEEK